VDQPEGGVDPPRVVDRVAPRRVRLAAACLFLVCLLVYATTYTTGNVCLDVWSANYATWHWMATGHPWIDGLRIPQIQDNQFHSVWIVQAAHGHTAIGRAPGVIAAAIPAYLLLHPSQMTIAPGGLTAAVITACSVPLLFLALATRLSTRRALVCAAAFGFATPVWSVAADALWPHTLTVLAICGMAWGSASKRWWVVGIFAGIGVWGRLHFALIAAVLGLFLAWRRREPGIAVRIGTVGLASVLLSSVWIHQMYGTWNPMEYQAGGTYAGQAVVTGSQFGLVNQLGLWVAPDRGILVWTPVLLLLGFALVRGWKDLPDWSRALMWGGIAYTLLQGRINTFTGGDPFYGYRLGLEFLACATPALAMTSARMGGVAKALVAPVLSAQFFIIMLGSVSDSYYLDVSRAWHDNAFLLAVRVHPAGVLTTLLAFVVAAIAVRAVWTRQQRPDPPVDEPVLSPGLSGHA
jgi:alpha-1,2-mannosyltransferase